MNKKLVWLSILSIFFLTWGAAGFGVMGSHKELLTGSTIPHGANTTVPAEATEPRLIPVTGKPHLGWGTLLFYVLIALATLTLILALLDSANQSTALYANRNPSQEQIHKEG